MPSNHLILCRPLLLLPSVFLSIRVFSSESVLRIRWPKYWSFSFSISPSNEYSELVSFRIDWFVIFLNFRNLPLGNSQRCVNYKNYNERTCACQQYYMYRQIQTSLYIDRQIRRQIQASQVALVVKNPPASAGDIRDEGSIPGLGSSPGGQHGNPFQYSCLENPMDREA